MDTTLAILGFALSVAALVPAFASKNPKSKIIIVFLLLSVVLIFGYQVGEVVVHKRQIASIKRNLLQIVTNKHEVTFDELLHESYYAGFDEANQAIDEL